MTRRERWKLDDGNSIQVWFKEEYYQVLCVARTQWSYPDQALNAEFREVTKDIGKRVVDLLNGDALHWTSEKPTVPGYYWYREFLSDARLHTYMVLIDDSLWMVYGRSRDEFGGKTIQRAFRYMAGQWAGPIPEPMDMESK